MTMTMSKKELMDALRPDIEAEVETALAEHLKELQKPVTNFGEFIAGTQPTRAQANGEGLSKVIRGLAMGGVRGAQQAASAYGGDTVVKSLGADDVSGGGIMVEGQLASEIIDLLRPRSVVRAMGPRIITAERGTFTFPKLTASASAGYVAENADIPMSEEEFGAVVMTAKKLLRWCRCQTNCFNSRARVPTPSSGMTL